MSLIPSKLSQEEANAGVEAMKMGNRQKAGEHFWKALNHLDDIEDLSERRGYLAAISQLFSQTEFPDLALAASQDAVEIDEQREDMRNLTNDLLDVGNAQMNMNNWDEALKNYERALKTCLEKKYYDNAASASTNLGSIFWNRDENDKAIKMMNDSLKYLKKEPNPETEITTRVYLLNMLEYEKHDPEQVFKVAKPVVAQFSDQLRDDQWDLIRKSLDKSIKRYVAKNPQIDANAWKAKNFPALYG
jgi:tetratricopeptide (TPR) repeat protein